MAGADEDTNKAEAAEEPKVKRQSPIWLKPALAGLALLVLAGAAGFGVGILTRSDDSGPDLSQAEAFARSKEQATKEVRREMARRGFVAGKRSGRSHGIIAGGMAAESAVTIVVREQAATAAQSAAASAQSELSGISGGAPPVPTFGGD